MRRRMLGVLVVAVAGLGLGGCFSQPAPALRVVDARLGESTDAGFVVEVFVEGENRGPDELPLRGVEYTVSIGGRQVFRGLRSAGATLPGDGTQMIRLPAAVPAGEWAGPLPAPGTPVEIAGQVTYISPGVFSRILFDADVLRPNVGFRGEAPLAAPASAPSAPAARGAGG